MPTFALVMLLLVPGMSEPMVDRMPMESPQACFAKAAEMMEGLKKHEGEAFKALIACEVVSAKSNPT